MCAAKYDNATTGDQTLGRREYLLLCHEIGVIVIEEGAHCFEKEERVFFQENFQKKVNETIKSK